MKRSEFLKIFGGAMFATQLPNLLDDLGKVAKSAWVLEQGEYHFHVGTSVRNTVELDYIYTAYTRHQTRHSPSHN